jgi:hypothetical protein
MREGEKVRKKANGDKGNGERKRNEHMGRMDRAETEGGRERERNRATGYEIIEIERRAGDPGKEIKKRGRKELSGREWREPRRENKNARWRRRMEKDISEEGREWESEGAGKREKANWRETGQQRVQASARSREIIKEREAPREAREERESKRR